MQHLTRLFYGTEYVLNLCMQSIVARWTENLFSLCVSSKIVKCSHFSFESSLDYFWTAEKQQRIVARLHICDPL